MLCAMVASVVSTQKQTLALFLGDDIHLALFFEISLVKVFFVLLGVLSRFVRYIYSILSKGCLNGLTYAQSAAQMCVASFKLYFKIDLKDK